MAQMNSLPSAPVILYDGACNLCNASVDFVLRHDAAGRFRFAALQSGAGQRLMRLCAADQPLGEAIILVWAGTCHTGSDAIFGILRLLPGGWALLGGLRRAPRPLREWAYRIVSRNRYRWFGATVACRLTLDGFEDRFLE
jgi:predicted DCC family thiol-disulfide oxidoreductase YuxK